ncbi:MAG: sigma-70 family RNA polymerase sigma factor [Myxococcales bacterium]|nr:sigma-70 family RNA polymerase sigma factor [Myxococcales bacterium]
MQATPMRFEAVYRREFPFVWAAARRLGVHPAALDDAVQDVFVTAYRRWDDLDYEVSPRAWLYGVTRRVAFRYRRSEARTARRKSAVGVASRRRDEPHARLEGSHDVDSVLAELPPERREVFVMSELLDMSGPEIAAELGVPLNTVYSRLRLARRQLARSVATQGEWLHAARRTQRPPPGQARRTWALIVPSLGRLSLAPIGVGLGGKLGLGLGGKLGLVVAAALGLVVINGLTIDDDARSPGAVAREPAPSAPEAVASASPSRPDAPRAPSPDEPSPTTALPSAVTAPSPRPASPSGSTPATRSAPGSTTSTPADEPSPLAEEVAVLDRAAEALRNGRAARSLQWLAEHEARFPHGHLADLRKATRVRALCELGQHARARAEAAALRREHPGSAVARGVSDSCGDA